MSGTEPQWLPPVRLRNLVSWQANRVSTVGTRLTGRGMPSTGRADFALLATLDEFGSLSQADLGRHLGLDRNDINGVVTRLEAAGHIARRTDPEDRRRNIVELSIAGSAYLDDLQARADDVQRELLAGLSATEEQQLIALLDKLLVAHGAQSA